MKLTARLLKSVKSALSPTGTQHWIEQRLSGLLSIAFGIWFLFVAPGFSGYSHEDLLLWIGKPQHALPLVIGVLPITWHSWLGVQVVIEDYVHDKQMRHLSLRISWLSHEILGTFIVVMILSTAFGVVW